MKEPDHFDKLFWFVVSLVAFGLMYMVALTFIPIPKENIRFADTSIGWVQGSVVTSAIAYLLGGNAPAKKNLNDGTTTADITASITTNTDKES